MIGEYYKNLKEIQEEIDNTWGMQRLLSLVTDELRVKFVKAQETFKRRRTKAKDKEARRLYESMIRGYVALISEATEMGYEPIMPDCWLIPHPNKQDSIVLVKDPELFTVVHHKYREEKNTKVLHISNLLRVVDWSILDYTLDLSKQFGDVTIQEVKFH